MPENPKEKNDKESEAEKSRKGKSETDEKSSWSRDQREKSYYYDDAHGYEIYNPDEDDAEEEDE
jgi:hypothetical protein